MLKSAGDAHEGEGDVMTRLSLLLSCAVGLVLASAGAVNADALAVVADAVDPGDGSGISGSTQVEDLIVTAQKREERLQRVPIAVSAYGTETLERANVDTVADLQNLAPSLQFASLDGAALISIRGIGTTVLGPGEDPGIAVHVDGVYLARPQYHDAALFDIARVEVLRGPQGTVNGRNATGGAINVITQQPTAEPGGYMNAGIGNYNAVATSGAFGGALGSDRVMGRVAWRTNYHQGYTPNMFEGVDLDEANQQSVRGQLLFLLGDRSELLLSLDTDHMDTSGFANIVVGAIGRGPLPGVAAGGAIGSGRTVMTNGPAYYRRDIVGGSARLRVNFDNMVLTATAGYRQFKERAGADLDGTSFDYARERHLREQWQISQELNLASDSSSKLSWLLGLYYLQEEQDSDERYTFPSLGFNFSLGGTPQGSSYAAYAQGTYAFSDRFDITGGIRYTRDQKKAQEYQRVPEFLSNVSAALSGEWGAATPKVSLNFRPTEDALFYASASRGFRSGGFNIGGLQGQAFNPEFIWSYELGSKQQFFDRRLTVNVALFHSDYTDMQVFQIRALTATVENAASATLKGGEFELVALPAKGIRVDVAGSYIDATFNEFSTVDESRSGLGLLNLAGNQLARAPKARLNIGVEKRWELANDGDFTVRAEYGWTDQVYYSEFNLPEMSQPAVTILNLRSAYVSPGGRYRFSAYVENLTDEAIISNKLVGAGLLGFGIIEWPAPPRTFGIQLGAKF
jgi:iron complex outermembrane receptor protein